MIKVYVPTEFEQLQDVWELLEKGDEMTYFQSYRWYKQINRHFMQENAKNIFREGVYVVSFVENNPIMIAPIQVIKKSVYISGIGLKKGFYFIGRQGYSDYLNLIYREFNPLAFEEILHWLKETYGFNYFHFENLIQNIGTTKAVEKYDFIQNLSLCMALTLPDSVEKYKSILSKSMRQNIRTAKNRAQKDGHSFEWYILDEVSDEFAEELNKIRSLRLAGKKKKTFTSLSIKAKIYTIARTVMINIFNKPINVFTEVDDKWCLVVKKQEETVAFFYGVLDKQRNTVYLLLAGVDPKYEHYSPGTVGLYEYICQQIESDVENKVKIFDFTRGSESYKYKFKAEEIVTVEVCFSI